MIEQLNDHQFKMLKRLANSPVKVYCCPAGIASDKKCDEITEDFNSILRLVELGLMSDASDWPKYAGLVKKFWEDDGRIVAIVNINGIGDLMFGRTPWEKWKN